jgi:hypothetical protein
MTTPKIFDISKCKVYVDGVEMVDIGSGIGITPKRATKVIDSLYGPVGFNIDPNTGAEVTLSLLSTSSSNDKMRAIANSQKVVSVSIKSADTAATGFGEISVDYVIFQHAEKKLEGDAPTYEYKGVGYGFGEK